MAVSAPIRGISLPRIECLVRVTQVQEDARKTEGAAFRRPLPNQVPQSYGYPLGVRAAPTEPEPVDALEVAGDVTAQVPET